MSPRRYLPSAQFAAMAAALLASGGLVLGAHYLTRPHIAPTVAATAQPPANPDWQQTLDEIEAQSGATLPPAPSASTTQALLAAAQSSNVTDTIARSLLINLSNEEAQGLGSDVPTQDALVSQALSQLPALPPTSYTANDLTVAAQSQDALHAYGNAVMVVFGANTGATSQATFTDIANLADSGDSADMASLSAVGTQYDQLVSGLAKVPVPQTLVPLQLEALNDLSDAAQTFPGMETVGTDPLRAIQSLEQYQQELNAAGLVFTTIAQTLNNDGILFTKDEPGSAWSGFLSTSQ